MTPYAADIIVVVVLLLILVFFVFWISDLKDRIVKLEDWQDKHQWQADRAIGMPAPDEDLTRPWARRR